MDLKVAVPWWTPRNVGGSQQAIRGNVRGFVELGADVDLYVIRDWSDLQALTDGFGAYDLVLWPFLANSADHEPGEAHVHQVVGGFGDPNLPDEQVRQTFDDADSVSFLDPLLAEHFDERVGVDLGRARMLLNPPNRELFDGDYVDDWVVDCEECGIVAAADFEQQAHAHRGGHLSGYGHDATVHHRRFVDGGDGHVLVPKIGNRYKPGDALATIAAATPDVVYETSVVQPLGTTEATGTPDLPPNVYVRPGVPYTAMPRRYRRASAVLNVSEQEAGPNVAYEAWLADRPFLCTPGGIGYHKSLPAVAVDVDDVGAPMEWWLDHRRGYVGAGNGEHYRAAEPAALADRVRAVIANDELRADLVEGGREWLAQLRGYGWAERARTIVEIMEET